jgi:hypothetical protein
MIDGLTVGLAVGLAVGLPVGLTVEPAVGLAEGLDVVLAVGLAVGLTVGLVVGLEVGGGFSCNCKLYTASSQATKPEVAENMSTLTSLRRMADPFISAVFARRLCQPVFPAFL